MSSNRSTGQGRGNAARKPTLAGMGGAIFRIVVVKNIPVSAPDPATATPAHGTQFNVNVTWGPNNTLQTATLKLSQAPINTPDAAVVDGTTFNMAPGAAQATVTFTPTALTATGDTWISTWTEVGGQEVASNGVMVSIV